MQKRHLLASGEKEHQSGYRIQFYDITLTNYVLFIAQPNPVLFFGV